MVYFLKQILLLGLVFCLCGIKSAENYLQLFQHSKKCTACKEC
jgi:hypothetical protein